jgi:DNA ligase-1
VDYLIKENGTLESNFPLSTEPNSYLELTRIHFISISNMGTPSKRRKLNESSKPSPIPSRSLDYFFGKQAQKPSGSSSSKNGGEVTLPSDPSELTDEQLARKLQAEWDQQDSARISIKSQGLASDLANQIPQSSGIQSESQEAKEETHNIGNEDSNHDLKHEGESTNSGFQRSQGMNKTLTLQSTGSEEDTITSNIPFDASPLIFDPSKYTAELQNHWAAEEGNSSYALLTRCFVLVNNTQSRIKIVDTLVNLLRVIIEGDPSSLLPTVRIICHFIFLDRN